MQENVKRPISKFTISLIVLCVLAIGASVWFYLLYSGKQTESAKQQQIVERIAHAVELPAETPTVVTIADKDKLTNKQLSAKVTNGDILLVFAQAKRLIVYRPSTEKVINMLSFENTSEVSTDTTKRTK